MFLLVLIWPLYDSGFNVDLLGNLVRLALLGSFFYPFVGWGIMSCVIMLFQRNEDRLG